MKPSNFFLKNVFRNFSFLTLALIQISVDGQVIDKYGQYINENWTGKVTSDRQLQIEYIAENNDLINIRLDSTAFDQYGGIKDGDQRSATGFFRTEKIHGIWWLITPDGYKFLLKGIDELTYKGYANSTDASNTSKFQQLPSKTTYADAWNYNQVNFNTANIMKKYGRNWKSKWRDLMKHRLLSWGFNAVAKWDFDPALGLPYIVGLGIDGAKWITSYSNDPYDTNFQVCVENTNKSKLSNSKNDKWIIGYFIENEGGWNDSTIQVLLQMDHNLAAKRAFIDFELSRYNNSINNLNSLFGTNALSESALKDMPINANKVPSADKKAFIKDASKQYYSKVRYVIKQNDPNHLFLGSSVVPYWQSNIEWALGGAQYLDALSYDYYLHDTQPIQDYECDKPLMNLELSYGCDGRGLIAYPPSCNSFSDRGEIYSNMIEDMFSHPSFVGMGWFVLYDEPITGRPGDGEHYQEGLLNVVDQPYMGLLNRVQISNVKLWDIHKAALPYSTTQNQHY